MIDKYGRDINYMRISITELCNLRCRYCMPEEGIVKRSHDEMMTVEETTDAVRAAVALGINKIRITGGEPLVKHGVIKLCSEIASISGVRELCMTTNGTLLTQYAKDLKAAGVDRLNISLDTLDPDKFKYITRRGDVRDALAGIDAAFDADFENIKINNVLMGGFNDDEIADFVNLTKDRRIDVRFIELMPIGGGIGLEKTRFVDCRRVLEVVPSLQSSGLMEGVAEIYRLPDAPGRVGLIKPISCAFCSGCNKIRLMADGMLKPCLHSGEEISIKGKTLPEMTRIMRETILNKPRMRDTLDVKNPGKATITVTGKGSYAGTATVTFKITPKKASVSKVTSPKKGTLKVSWKKDSKASGYQVVIAKNKKFTSGKKTATVKSNKTTAKTFTKLSKGKKYYVKVRAYKTIDGKKVYGKYSSVKTKTVKK